MKSTPRLNTRDHDPRRADQCNLHTHVIANKNKSPIENLHSNKMYLQSPAVTNPLARLNYATRRRVQLGNKPPTSH
eukprot:scaffold46716_cov72-Phaeocystis_antarctica.AAC.2